MAAMILSGTLLASMLFPETRTAGQQREGSGKEVPMPTEIKVAPPGITISQGRTFMVTDECGEISPAGEAGLYAIDTRFISKYHLAINQASWELVTSSELSFYAARVHLANPPLSLTDGDLAANMLGLTIDRMVGGGVHEDLAITNYSGRQVHFTLEIDLESDFADVFEVRTRHLIQRGHLLTQWDDKNKQLRTTYTNHDFYRAVTYEISETNVPIGFAN